MSIRVAGLVLAAGSSRRLGRPKQLLPYGDRTLLDASLDVARAAPFDQRLVTVGGSAPEVVEQVDLDGFTVVDNLHFTQGCSSSIVAAVARVDPAVDGLVMLLGDQPGVTPAALDALLAVADRSCLAVCAYRDGIGHPFWFGKDLFGELELLHGDKAVWKLVESGRFVVREAEVDGPIPLDVDTWDDYELLLAESAEA